MEQVLIKIAEKMKKAPSLGVYRDMCNFCREVTKRLRKQPRIWDTARKTHSEHLLRCMRKIPHPKRNKITN